MSRRRRKRSSSRRREFQIKKKRETKTHTVVAVVEEAKKNHRKHLSNVPGNYKRQYTRQYASSGFCGLCRVESEGEGGRRGVV